MEKPGRASKGGLCRCSNRRRLFQQEMSHCLLVIGALGRLDFGGHIQAWGPRMGLVALALWVI